MRIMLEIKSGPSTGRKIHLQPGQAAEFGGTEWADFSFADDQMSEVHFAVEHQGGDWQIRDLNSETGTLVNEDPVKIQSLHTGDLVVAGRTTFSIEVEGESAPVVDSAGPEVTGGDNAQGVAADQTDSGEASADECEDYMTPPGERTAVELYEYLEHDDDAVKQIAHESKTSSAYLAALTAKPAYKAAVRVQAHLLPKRKAIWWAFLCVDELVGEQLDDKEQAAMTATKTWIIDPSDDNRRAAGKTGETLNHTGPAAWLANGVLWAGGSLAPPGNDVIPPDERLTGQAIFAALTLSVVRPHPETPEIAAKRFQIILAKAKDVDGDKIELPQAT